jgi:hypothetical protein
MVFCCLTDSGQKFGPFFLPDGGMVTQHSYRELLEEELFPQMQQQLGRRGWRDLVWQQDGASPHQARMHYGVLMCQLEPLDFSKIWIFLDMVLLALYLYE